MSAYRRFRQVLGAIAIATLSLSLSTQAMAASGLIPIQLDQTQSRDRRAAPRSGVPDSFSQNALAQSVWRVFISETGRFRILMPGDPQQSNQPQETPIGQLNLYSYAVERPREAVYMATYTDFPADYINNTDPNELLNNGRDEVVRRLNGTLLQEVRLNLNGAPGLEIKVKIPQDMVIYNRIYLVRQRLYQLIVVTTLAQERSLPRSIAGFFESFQLLRQEAASTNPSPSAPVEP